MKNKHVIDIKSTPLIPTQAVAAYDANGNQKPIELVGESALTIYLNRIEIVTVMTMGATPAYLIIGFLLNQQLIQSINDISAIHIDWETHAAAVTATTTSALQEKTQQRIVTSGCGQGTMFANVVNNLTTTAQNRPNIKLSPTEIRELLIQLTQENAIYKKAGGVHTCALCTKDQVIKSIEDVGRHNALDSLTGFLALEAPEVSPSIMYTTGRLTSEMVIKTVQMNIPLIISRSGATSMGVEIAKKAGITIISRAKGKHFLVLNGSENILFPTPDVTNR